MFLLEKKRVKMRSLNIISVYCIKAVFVKNLKINESSIIQIEPQCDHLDWWKLKTWLFIIDAMYLSGLQHVQTVSPISLLLLFPILHNHPILVNWIDSWEI